MVNRHLNISLPTSHVEEIGLKMLQRRRRKSSITKEMEKGKFRSSQKKNYLEKRRVIWVWHQQLQLAGFSNGLSVDGTFAIYLLSFLCFAQLRCFFFLLFAAKIPFVVLPHHFTILQVIIFCGVSTILLLLLDGVYIQSPFFPFNGLSRIVVVGMSLLQYQEGTQIVKGNQCSIIEESVKSWESFSGKKWSCHQIKAELSAINHKCLLGNNLQRF